MQLCSDDHGEVCYESRNCPACEALEALTKVKDAEIKGLETQIGTLQEEKYELGQKLGDIESQKQADAS